MTSVKALPPKETTESSPDRGGDNGNGSGHNFRIKSIKYGIKSRSYYQEQYGILTRPN